MGEPSESRTDPFSDWLAAGLAAGYCGPPVCETHDGTPTSMAEELEFESGADPCLHILRLYPDANTKTAIEDNHPPSVWRKP